MKKCVEVHVSKKVTGQILYFFNTDEHDLENYDYD